ncbi:MAG: fatty acid desaturase [Planctomycetota bacterium]|nr:fatty acid desaturase [Planctomycetota bacterium]MEC9046654.1 fatty acid desaturase [Planctomycetota bacterium]
MVTSDSTAAASASRGDAAVAHPSAQKPELVASKLCVADWRPIVAEFQRPCAWRAGWQLGSTLALYVATWVSLYFAVAVSWWLAAPLVLVGAGLLVRIFIIFHDCTHSSFVSSRVATDLIGAATGVLTFTPYRQWRAEHAIHHGANGDLDRRGIGDIWTMTVDEYLGSSKWRRFCYRIARNPITLFLVAPFLLFVVLHRFSRSNASEAERASVRNTNIALFGVLCVMGSIFGFVPFLILQLSVMTCAGVMGIWLFYMQHQFEDVYWERHEEWDYTIAALQGSSYLRLPKVLQWFSGNIGFHHIHHLSPRIPNYNLERCHNSNPLFQNVHVMTFWSSFRSMRLRLWDEASRRLVTWREFRELRQAAAR